MTDQVGGHGKLLLAEDNRISREMILAMLADTGYQVRTAEDGRLALQALESEQFDAVLMDCQMPWMDGFEATRRLREREAPLARRTPVIAVTGNAIQGERQRCLDAGMDDYLAKPVARDALLLMLKRWIVAPRAVAKIEPAV